MPFTIRKLVASLPTLYLGLHVLYGAFSRFTHGAYTPSFYAWQKSHMAPDDPNADSKIIPTMDTVIALSMLLGPRKVRFGAAVIATVFVAIGLGMMVSKDQDGLWDFVSVVAGMGTIWGNSAPGMRWANGGRE